MSLDLAVGEIFAQVVELFGPLPRQYAYDVEIVNASEHLTWMARIEDEGDGSEPLASSEDKTGTISI